MIGANLSPPFNTTRASHAVMTARDLDRTQEFYCDVRMLTAHKVWAATRPGRRL